VVVEEELEMERLVLLADQVVNLVARVEDYPIILDLLVQVWEVETLPQ
jgi:hypothetical protein